ncbi:MAG: hypothetical protein KJ826_09335 [Proteobacteria bacterium]|nr:hypothetical protein [Pseudomonadota bacterium]
MSNKVIVRVILIMLCFVVVSATASSDETPAKEVEKNNALPVINNIGFMKNPPKELKERFPMCDAFLKVEWIDKEKMIGYSRYDVYWNGKKQKQKAFALVHLDKTYPTFNYDLSVFEGKEKIGTKEVFSIIKRGKVAFPFSCLSVDYNCDKNGSCKSLDFTTIDITRQMYSLTLADNRLTVGIPYPDNQKVWIAEGKQIDKLYNKEEAVKLYKKNKHAWT